MLGSGLTEPNELQGGRDRQEVVSAGTSSERSDWPPQGSVSADRCDSDQELTSTSETFLIEQCIREYNQFLKNPGPAKHANHAEPCRQPYKQNHILQEMLQYGVTQGWVPRRAFDWSLISRN